MQSFHVPKVNLWWEWMAHSHIIWSFGRFMPHRITNLVMLTKDSNIYARVSCIPLICKGRRLYVELKKPGITFKHCRKLPWQPYYRNWGKKWNVAKPGGGCDDRSVLPILTIMFIAGQILSCTFVQVRFEMLICTPRFPATQNHVSWCSKILQTRKLH